MKNLFSKKNIAVNIIIFGVLLSLTLIAVPIGVNNVSNSVENVFYIGDTTKNNVAMMFNVYSGTEYIDDIIEILDEYNVSATFFVGGLWVEKNPDTLLQIASSNNEIGNHGYLHIDHSTASDERQLEEINTCHQLVKSITGIDMDLFAPPSGAYNDNTSSLALTLGYSTVMWTLDSIDWRDEDSSLVFSRLTKLPQNGALLLMHPTAHTVSALPDVIEFYLNSEYNLTNVSSCLNISV